MCPTIKRRSWISISFVLGVMLAIGGVAQARDAAGLVGQGAPIVSSRSAFVRPYFFGVGGFGPFGYYGGYYTPFVNVPTYGSTYPYLPKYWWVERYPSTDPRQAGYNPNSGYPKEEVTTLLLVSYPVKSRVILDGLYVGTSDNLGPIQLPVGVHVLRVESLGFEPSETVLKVEQPTLQQLEVRLKSASQADNSAQRK
jgi:hypothetical protein